MSNYLLSQYQNTNVEQFCEAIRALMKEMCIDPVDEYYKDWYDLRTCNSDALDLWGKVLNFPRFVRVSDDIFEYEELEDYQYRTILQCIYIQTSLEPTINNLNENLGTIFENLGLTLGISDPGSMRFVTYIVTGYVPAWLENIFDRYDILPRPAGVKIAITERETFFLGLEGQQADTLAFVSNLTHTVFHDKEVPGKINRYDTIEAFLTDVNYYNNVFVNGLTSGKYQEVGFCSSYEINQKEIKYNLLTLKGHYAYYKYTYDTENQYNINSLRGLAAQLVSWSTATFNQEYIESAPLFEKLWYDGNEIMIGISGKATKDNFIDLPPNEPDGVELRIICWEATVAIYAIGQKTWQKAFTQNVDYDEEWIEIVIQF